MCTIDKVTVSPKYQVVIPKLLREKMGIKPGQKLQIFEIDGRIELVPVPKKGQARGFLPGLDTRVERDNDRIV